MTKLELSKSASDMAFEKVNVSAPTLDSTVAAYAESQSLSDADYNVLKNAVSQFRQIYQRSAAEDARVSAAAKRAEELKSKAAASTAPLAAANAAIETIPQASPPA